MTMDPTTERRRWKMKMKKIEKQRVLPSQQLEGVMQQLLQE
jgi:hypothetical protein